jgi:hypothetical protein
MHSGNVDTNNSYGAVGLPRSPSIETLAQAG